MLLNVELFNILKFNKNGRYNDKQKVYFLIITHIKWCGGRDLLLMRTTWRANTDVWGGDWDGKWWWPVADWEPTGEVCLHEVCLCRGERLVR